MQIPVDECRRIIEGQLGCVATFAYACPIREIWGDFLIDATVYVFELTGHPKATEAYACPPSPMGNQQKGMVLVLRGGSIDGPIAAMRSILNITL